MDEFEQRQIYGSKRNFLKVAKDSVCYSLELGNRGIFYPNFQGFNGHIEKDKVSLLRDEIWSIIKSPLEIMVEEDGEFVPVEIIPCETLSRTGFAKLIPSVYDEYPNQQLKDFLILLYNECNEAEYRGKPLNIRKKLNDLGI